MKTSRIVSATLAACILSLSSVAFAAEEQKPATGSDTDKPASTTVKPTSTLTERERDWIEDKCKALHPINKENRQKCIEEKEKTKEAEKAKKHKK